MSEISGAIQRLKDLHEELQQLEETRDAIYVALDAIENADCAFSSTGLGQDLSHHASMEIEESLCMVDERIEEIEGAAEQL